MPTPETVTPRQPVTEAGKALPFSGDYPKVAYITPSQVVAIEAEARAQAERELLVQVMNLVRKRYWDWHSNGPKGKAQAADAILGDILETFEEAATLSVQRFFAATDPSVNPMVASLLNENRRAEKQSA